MTRIIPGWQWPAVSEFCGYTGDCMENALMACMAAARNLPPTPAWLNSIVADMAARHLLAASNGATNVAACAAFARQYSYDVRAEQDYQYPLPSPILPILEANAGILPILLNVQNAQALTDAWKGTSDERGVHLHGLAILGILDNGYLIAMDGDNPQAAVGRFVAYSPAVIEAAQPCGYLILGRQV